MKGRKDEYLFPAIFTKDADGVSVEFPDLPGCYTCGATVEEAMLMARDALSLHLYSLEEDGAPIPEPSSFESLEHGPNQFVAAIEAKMAPYRDRIANKAVKKTLTIPKWLDDLATEHRVNFSLVLQEALKQKLGVMEPRRGYGIQGKEENDGGGQRR
ncbi:MAG: type II toxin-antitoxin system HicB family antitoxin [Firmicutes bacterium]|nr:type II toxin-antitoxin system HicB family antitoxin [Bacillota bacterium]